jgi:hypothetical protein
MDIQQVEFVDLESVKRFISQVSEMDVLPNFNDQEMLNTKCVFYRTL